MLVLEEEEEEGGNVQGQGERSKDVEARDMEGQGEWVVWEEWEEEEEGAR